jgi:hypothetical protein
MSFRSIATSCLLIGFAVAAAEAAQPSTAVPQVIAGSGVAPYVWIAAESLVDGAGNLETSKLGPTATRVLENYMNSKASRSEQRTISASVFADADPCGGVSMAFPSMEEYRPTSTLGDLLRESSDILAGEVVAVSLGAFKGTPGSLLRIRVLRTLRDSDDVTRTNGTVLLAYPYATLRVHERTYCTRAFSLEGMLPPLAAGDRVILFNYSSGLGIEHSVIEVDVARQLIIEHSGALTIPTGIRVAAPGTNFDSILAELSMRLQKKPDAGRGALRGGNAN